MTTRLLTFLSLPPVRVEAVGSHALYLQRPGMIQDARDTDRCQGTRRLSRHCICIALHDVAYMVCAAPRSNGSRASRLEPCSQVLPTCPSCTTRYRRCAGNVDAIEHNRPQPSPPPLILHVRFSVVPAAVVTPFPCLLLLLRFFWCSSYLGCGQ